MAPCHFLFKFIWTLWGLSVCLHHILSFLLSSAYIIYMASFSQLTQVSTSSLCFYSLFILLLFLYFPRLANNIRKQSKGKVPCHKSFPDLWKKTNLFGRKPTPWKGLTGSQREERRGKKARHITDLITGGLRIIMNFLFCFWPSTCCIFLSLGAFHWDPSVIKYLVIEIKKKWWKEHSSDPIISKGLLK